MGKRLDAYLEAIQEIKISKGMEFQAEGCEWEVTKVSETESRAKCKTGDRKDEEKVFDNKIIYRSRKIGSRSEMQYTRSGKGPRSVNDYAQPHLATFDDDELTELIETEKKKGTPTKKIVQMINNHGVTYMKPEEQRKWRIMAGEKYDANGKFKGYEVE